MNTPQGDGTSEIALIVGAGTGLSASFARLCAREGMRVGLAARQTAKLASLAARFESSGVEIGREVIYGRPAVDIARFAESKGVDLIAMASHTVDPTRPGRGWGTLSYKIGMLASCPVLLVK